VNNVFSSRAFSVSAPTVWNLLQSETCLSDAYVTFRNTLKTELFMKNYDNQIDTGAIAAPLIRMRFTFGRVTNSILDWIGLDLDYKLFASFDDRTADEWALVPYLAHQDTRIHMGWCPENCP